MGFRLLQRRIFREMSVASGICLAALLGLLLLGRLLQLRDLFMGQGSGILDLGRLFLYLTPFFLIFLVPVSCMMGLFLTFLRMDADRELISLRASGISVWSLLPASVFLCLLYTALTLWTSLFGISWGMDNFRQTVMDMARHKTEITVQPGVFNTTFPGMTLYSRQTDPVSGELSGIFILDASKPGTRATIVAPKGQIIADAKRGQIFVRLHNGHIYRQAKGELSVIGFEKYLLALKMSQLLGGYELSDKTPAEMSWSELRFLAAGGYADQDEKFQRRVDIELQKRFALPFACLVLGFFALPLAFLFQGLKKQFGLVVCLGAFFVYYVFLSLGISLAESGTTDAATALWLPNLVFFLAGCGGMWMVAEERRVNLSALPRWLGRAISIKRADA